MILAGLLTVALLAFAARLVRDFPPAPTRRWALAFVGMSVAMLVQMWRAEFWKKEIL